MPTKVKTKSTGAKAKPAAAKGSTNGAKAAKNTGQSDAQRKRGELNAKLRKEASAIAKRLQGDGKMKDEKARYGLSDDGPIRKALAQEGFDSKGGTLTLGSEIDATKAAGKKAVVKARTEGEPWYILELRTGLSESELKAIVKDAGGPTGRVYRGR